MLFVIIISLFIQSIFRSFLMSIARPVSVETLSSIPWMSAKSLSHAMREVSLRGPNDAETWQQLCSRGDVIVKSFNPKQAALVLNSLARVKSKGILEVDFIRRFVHKFLPAIVTDCNALDTAQILHALSEFKSIVKIEIFEQVADRVTACASQLDERGVSMVATAVSRVPDMVNDVMIHSVVSRGIEIGDLNDQTLSQVIHLASLGTVPVKDVSVLLAQATDRAHIMSVRSLVLITNSLTRLKEKFSIQEFVSMVSESVLDNSSSRFSEGASISQLVVLLRSLQKLRAQDTSPLVLHRTVELLSHRDIHSADVSSMVILLSALSRMPGESKLAGRVVAQLITRPFSTQDTVSVVTSLCRLRINDPQVISVITQKIPEMDFKTAELVGKALSKLDGF